MLGVTLDIRGPQYTQRTATKLRLTQRRLDSAVIAASVSSLTRASYTAQFTPWTVQDISDLDVPLNKLLRRLSRNMSTYSTHLLYLPTSMDGLGLPKLSTYVNTRKWCMVQRALLHDDNTAQVIAGLLDRAARFGGGRVDPGQPTGISPTATTPAWGSSFGAMASASFPILLQRGTFTSTTDLHLAPYIPTQYSRRLLHTLQRRGLMTLGDLTYAPPDAPRTWLPAEIQAAILPFPPPDLPPYPPTITPLHALASSGCSGAPQQRGGHLPNCCSWPIPCRGTPRSTLGPSRTAT